MEEHNQRVVEEKRQLDERLNKLEAFIKSETFKGLNNSEQYWLEKQAGVMADYSYVLGERLVRFA